MHDSSEMIVLDEWLRHLELEDEVPEPTSSEDMNVGSETRLPLP